MTGSTTTGDVSRARGPGRPPRTETESAAHRARLLESAMTTIGRRGGDVSMDEIAVAAGVSKPVLYAAFGDKAGMAEALAVHLAGRAEDQLIARVVTAGNVDPEAGLRFAIDILISLVTDQPQVYGFLVRSMRENDRGLLDNALVRTLHSRVLSLIGPLTPETDPALLSVLAHGMFGFVFASVESWHESGVPARSGLVDMLVTVVMTSFQNIGVPVPALPQKG